ncbi:MAG: hypothetical protein ACPIOQ_84145, partial [Promethearchaeia archaeon]
MHPCGFAGPADTLLSCGLAGQERTARRQAGIMSPQAVSRYAFFFDASPGTFASLDGLLKSQQSCRDFCFFRIVTTRMPMDDRMAAGKEDGVGHEGPATCGAK